MNDLNVFKWYYYNKTKIIKNTIQFFRNFKWAWQRATKGYADVDAWNLDSWLMSLLPNILTTLRDHAHGHPHDMSYEDWCKYLTEMANHFRVYNEEWENPVELPKLILTEMKNEDGTIFHSFSIDDSLKEEYEEKKLLWTQEEEKRNNYVNSELEKGFAMMRERLRDLWD